MLRDSNKIGADIGRARGLVQLLAKREGASEVKKGRLTSVVVPRSFCFPSKEGAVELSHPLHEMGEAQSPSDSRWEEEK